MKKVLVLDFGGQYNLLVARRVRECGVYCEIKSFRISMDEVRAFAPDALIFTGGPATVFEPKAPMVDKALFELGIPVLGICYGQQLMMHLLGGQCRGGDKSADMERVFDRFPRLKERCSRRTPSSVSSWLMRRLRRDLGMPRARSAAAKPPWSTTMAK